MPHKKKRGDIPNMSTLTATQQDAMMQRWQLRHDLRQAYQDIIDMLVVWCIDDVHIPSFHSKGHEGQFNYQPPADLMRRLEANGFSVDEIDAHLKTDEVAADWMTPEEVKALLHHIALMRDYFATHDPGPFAAALRIYYQLGQIVRYRFIQQYGYAPDDAPVPGVKIQGKESELSKLKPADHQPGLF